MILEIGLLITAGTIIFIVKNAESKIQELEIKKVILSEKLKEKNKNTQKKYNQTSKMKQENNIYEEKINGYDSFYPKKKQKMTYKEKIKKGKEYEEYIANYFKEQGYYVWEHGKEKGRKDKSIDLFVRKEDKAYFVQCKNWEKWKINHKEVKATRTDIREYLKENKEFWNLIKEKELKILYVTSKECLTRGAYKYIEENKEILEYQVIPMHNSQRND